MILPGVELKIFDLGVHTATAEARKLFLEFCENLQKTRQIEDASNQIERLRE